MEGEGVCGVVPGSEGFRATGVGSGREDQTGLGNTSHSGLATPDALMVLINSTAVGLKVGSTTNMDSSMDQTKKVELGTRRTLSFHQLHLHLQFHFRLYHFHFHLSSLLLPLPSLVSPPPPPIPPPNESRGKLLLISWRIVSGTACA